MFSSNAPTLTHRSATAPAKRLAFAANLSVYDTFPAAVYDRRSEPATWSRLTPALAQRIKEELNSYKMEEMEVHAASRVQYVARSFSVGTADCVLTSGVSFAALNSLYDVRTRVGSLSLFLIFAVHLSCMMTYEPTVLY